MNKIIDETKIKRIKEYRLCSFGWMYEILKMNAIEEIIRTVEEKIKDIQSRIRVI